MPTTVGRWKVRFLGKSAACLLGLNTLVVGLSCAPKEQGFACGVPSASQSGTVQRCARPHEFCICATNSCARQLPRPSAECTSSLVYVESPFASHDLVGQCVSAEAANTKVNQLVAATPCPEFQTDAALSEQAAPDANSIPDEGTQDPGNGGSDDS
jgi:hypothetical protein